MVNREGRPRTLNDEFHKEKLKELILEDHNWGTFEYAEKLGFHLLGHKKASERNRSQENCHQMGTTSADTRSEKFTRGYLY